MDKKARPRTVRLADTLFDAAFTPALIALAFSATFLAVTDTVGVSGELVWLALSTNLLILGVYLLLKIVKSIRPSADAPSPEMSSRARINLLLSVTVVVAATIAWRVYRGSPVLGASTIGLVAALALLGGYAWRRVSRLPRPPVASDTKRQLVRYLVVRFALLAVWFGAVYAGSQYAPSSNASMLIVLVATAGYLIAGRVAMRLLPPPPPVVDEEAS